MNTPDSRAEYIGITLALLAALGFSLKAIFVKLAYAWPVSAVTLLAIRMLLSLPVFAWIGWRSSRHAPPLSTRDRGVIFFLGLAGYYSSSILDFMGLQYISAGLERLILYTYPTLTILISVIIFKNKLHQREIGAILLSYLGIALAFIHDLNLSEDNHGIWLGASLVLASSLSYAIYLSGSARIIQRLGSARFTALCLLVSCGGVLLHFAVTQPLSAFQQPWQVYALGAAMAIISTILPVFMQSAAIRRIGAARAVLIGTIGPMGTIFFGWWLLNESLSLMQMIGASLVLLGVMLVSRRRS